ncbi:MAG: 16S rRNA (cytidine(1402)-2'-O)-methyltransferase [Ilumatobacteraceae bacterium]
MSALILVATPIGNMGDLSPRAVEHLRSAALVCCEDTRRSGLMLHNLGIDVPLLRVDEHTEMAALRRVVETLESGRSVCLVTDAGTPGISDPGSRLVAAVIERGLEVGAVPGPTALVMALSVSGLPTDRFVFEGFLPRRGTERTTRLHDVARQSRTTVLYEAPHRLLRTLGDLEDHCGGERRIAICRELTKVHEQIWRGTLADSTTYFESHEPVGEFVIVLAGAPAPAAASSADIDRALAARLAAGDGTKDAASHVAESLGVSKKLAYERALTLQEQPRPSR